MKAFYVISCISLAAASDIFAEWTAQFNEHFVKKVERQSTEPLVHINAPDNPTSQYWVANIPRKGSVPYRDLPGSPYRNNASAPYVLFRNVKDYGALGDGVTDDTNAINNAISIGPRCGNDCKSSSITPAIVYFPPGTYRVTTPIVMYYATQMIGDIFDPPVIKADPSFAGIGVLDSDPYFPNINPGKNWWQNQNNFWRQVRNFVIDITDMPPDYGACLHWQVAQATALLNIKFMMHEGGSANTQQGIFMDNGSGLFFSDLEFHGGAIGMFLGNQQFSAIRIKFFNCQTAVYMNWNWLWAFKSLEIHNSNVGIDMSTGGGTVQTVGNVLVQDSLFDNVLVGILTTFSNESTPVSGGTLNVDNCDFTTTTQAIANTNGTTILEGGSVVPGFAQGNVYTAYEAAEQFGNNTCYVPTALSSRVQEPIAAPPKPAFMLDNNGKWLERARPQYEDVLLTSFVSVKDNGATGDGVTDDTAAIQSIIDRATFDDVIYFDHGAYVVTDTIYIPGHIRITGEMWPMIMFTGPNFSDMNNPIPGFQVGKPGEVGKVEISDILFETIGPTPGLIIVEWNLDQDGPGTAGLWDTHWRIGGSMGTKLQSDRCAKTPKVRTAPDPQCYAAFLLFHITKYASLITENTWGWVADHELDLPNEVQINLYNGRGLLVESSKGVWLYGASFEHSVLYNFHVANAQNVYMSIIQSETAYMQANPNALVPYPANSSYSDPKFDNCFESICYKTWGLRIYNSTYVFNYGAGLYSFFDNYDGGCILTESCQQNMVDIEMSEAIYLYGLNTVASDNMVQVDNTALVPAAANSNGFAETVAIFEYP